MKIIDNANNYRKDYLYEQYTRIVRDFKDYDSISRKKMLLKITELYSDYNRIIDICSERELKYLKRVLNGDFKESLKDPAQKIKHLKKYEWEIDALRGKYLLIHGSNDDLEIPEEILDSVNKAIKNVKWKYKKNEDRLNEFLIGYCKVQGSCLFDVLVMFANQVTGIDSKVLESFIYNNMMFNYYVYGYFEKDIYVLIYQDYYYLKDEIDEGRKKYGLAGDYKFDLEEFSTIFYNDFDIRNSDVKKFVDEAKKNPLFYLLAGKMVREGALLNIDKDILKKKICSLHAFKNRDLTYILKLMDKAIDEMPSGVLNGFTPNEAKKMKYESFKAKVEKEENYVKQRSACLSKSDAKLFYKIFFGLLEFTNNKYGIKPGLKIYNKLHINPNLLTDIINTFWENKDELVSEFCQNNPYNFNASELEVTSEFKRGVRDIYIIAKYEEEYTLFMSSDKIYMVKGINDNIDNIIPYDKLPYTVYTTIIPFKGNLIYDSILSAFNIEMGSGFDRVVTESLSSLMRYYHL